MSSLREQWPAGTFILIPAYKAASPLDALLPELIKTAPPSNVCVVDDASKDGTDAVCARQKIEYISLQTNQGKGAALQCGFNHLMAKNAKWILTMDADGQHSVKDIPLFLNRARENPNIGMIIGTRSMKIGTMPLPRIFSNAVTSVILSLFTGIKIPDSQCGFRMYSTRFLGQISLTYPRFEMETEAILKAWNRKWKICFVPVQTLYCSDKSHISHLKDTLRWIKAVIDIWTGLKKNRRISPARK